MITQISYNVLIERFKAFASGHYLIEGFTHGHPSAIDIQKDITFPWMHVFPIEVEPRAGSRLYSFIITFADLPRDKETPAEYQREVISDCIKLAEDFVAEVQNGLTLFGPTVELEGSPSIEVFIDEYSQTLTGVNLAVTLSVPWDWSACDIPADFAVGGSGSGGGGAGGGGIILKTNGVLNGLQSLLDLVEGTNITITDNGSGVVTISATGALGVSSVGLTMPTAFAVAGSPVTSSGTLAVTGAGTSLEYIDGTGDLQTFPTIPTLTSELTNDSGFIVIGDVPPQVNSDWTAVSGVEEILNKPTLAAVATSGDYNDLSNLPTIPTALDDLSDVFINAGTLANGQSLIYDSGSGYFKNDDIPAGGTVTSVGLTSSTSGITIGSSPVTSSGNITLAIATATAAQNGFLSSTDWATFNGKQNSIGLTTVGTNLATLPDPSAVRYLRINAGNDVSALTLAELKSDLGIGTAILATDFTNAAAAGYEDVTGLSFAVTSGKTYKWRATLAYTATSQGNFSINGPTATFNRYRFTSANTATGNLASNQSAYNLPATNAAIFTGVSTADGIIKASATGTIIIRMRGASIGGVTMLAGSIIEFEEFL